MKKNSLSQRLLTITDHITSNDNIIVDVGSDHAYISIYCLLYKGTSYAYNIENKQKPFERTVDNINKYNLNNKCLNIFADGLKTDLIKKPIDYCIISGMGDKNITNIIKNRNNNIKINEYIIVSNDNPITLRGYLKETNMRVSFEDVIIESHKNKNLYFFLTIISDKGINVKTINDIDYGPHNLKEKSNRFKM
ncbi:hypothetical protein FACS189459_4890 [Bacilli bacterium]|nr:hypothetical protein FACS189459_4890 [Bacilli bacterium]